MNRQLSLILIFIAATLWGVIGIFVTYLYKMGFTPFQVVAIRVSTAFLFLLIYTLAKDLRYLKIKPLDSRYFMGTGIISIVLFNWCLFSAMEETSISIAFVLLYTAPIFVTIFSKFFLNESFTLRKLAALCMTFTGCTLVIGLFPKMEGSISLYGLLLGLGAGLFYALYSILGKYALAKYNSLTVTVYTFLFASLAAVPFSQIWKITHLLSNVTLLIVIGLGFLSTMLPFLLYTKGLENVESSRASIIATVEPVVASLTGYLIFNEKLDSWQYFGIVLVIASVIIVQDSSKSLQRDSQMSKASNM
ncbi:Threonine/homoserine efflux transporter RhtA [Halobacillus alkaliphilus]|uniref:Threonine/homoserine efflux transporter RhtA n=1 Tax=Halobacillus alkaliphilus TaxID=396056 RepID=A0A1I2JRI2_9BACI|nr:DMT family transporter [Halobacillus alkaliphilus]SFF55376.1 Threonine/homoserine efflux transporter RhtA [Halobacillus alkaliphilus]